MTSKFEITEGWLMETAGWQVFKPARVLMAAGAVASIDFDGKTLKGAVMDGRKRLVAGLVIKGKTDVINLCSCPESRRSGAICAHSVALGLTHLASPREQDHKEKVPGSDSKSPGPLAAKSVVANTLTPIVYEDFYQKLKSRKFALSFDDSDVGLILRERLAGPDRDIVDVLSRAGLVSIPESFTSSGPEAEALFKAAIQHPGLTVETAERRLPVRIADSPGRVPVKLEQEGEFVMITSKADGHSVSSSDGYWWWVVTLSQGLLVPHVVPAEFVGVLTGRTLKVPERLLSQKAEAFFDAFEETLDSDPSIVRKLWGNAAVPKVELRIEGSLRALDADLLFYYPEGPVISHRASLKEGVFPYRDGEGTLQRRNVAFETGCLERLLDLGFVMDSNRLKIRDGETILRLLSTRLPMLRRHWSVEYGERIKGIATSVVAVRPAVEWHETEASTSRSGEDWLECSVVFEDDKGEPIPAADLQRMLRVGRGSYQRVDGKTVVVDLDGIEEWNACLEEVSARQDGSGALKVRRSQAGFIDATLEKIGAANGGLPAPEIEALQSFAVASELTEILRDYQKEGVQWIARQGLTYGGVILGDEMGLGKTLQTLSFLSGLATGSPSAGPALVVCPSSLLWSWEAEVKRFLPNFKIIVLHGTSRHKLFRNLNNYDLAVTSYALAIRDLEHWEQQGVRTIVIDEASYIRNPMTKVAKAMRRLASRASTRIALTGTPIENGVRDLWSIMEFALPGHLGPHQEFQERYEKPLARVGTDPVSAARLIDRLQRRIRPFFLRRTKLAVAPELPSKIETLRLIDLSKSQAAIYQGILRESSEVVSEAVRRGDSGARMQMLTALLRLRQVCCDPRLLGDKGPPGFKQIDSAKLEAFRMLLGRLLADGHSILVFSQFVSMLRLLRRVVEEAGSDYSYLDGASIDRADQVKAFQDEPKKRVFLISLKAGGYGLNLTKADTVVHFDPWWNPAVEAQATDRAHRIGQNRPVTVYKLIARNTVEEKIVRLQRKKRQTVDALIDDDQLLMQNLTSSDLEELLEH